MKSNVILYCKKIQALNTSIINAIPSGVLSDIKKSDSHPFFQLYSLCHEGISQPKLLGENDTQSITWPKKAIQSLKNIVLKGIKLFKGHNKDNSTEDRPDFGEVVHSFEKEINGELHHLVITYHKPEQKEEAKKIDIISQEGLWNFIESAKGLIADSVDTITGIAGGNSEHDTPAFSGAKKLGFVQAFENNEKDDNKGANKMGDTQIEKQLTFQEWRNMAKQFSVYPWQLFTLEDLKADREFGKHFLELDNIKTENESLKTELKDTTEKLTGEINLFKKQSFESTSKDRFKTIIEKSDLTDNMKKVIEKSFEKNNSSIDDLTDEGLAKYITQKKEDYQDFMNISDKTTTTKPPENNSKDEGGNDKEPEKNEYLEEDVDLENLY